MKTKKAILKIGKIKYVAGKQESKIFSVFKSKNGKFKCILFNLKSDFEVALFNGLSLSQSVYKTYSPEVGKRVCIAIIYSNTKVSRKQVGKLLAKSKAIYETAEKKAAPQVQQEKELTPAV